MPDENKADDKQSSEASSATADTAIVPAIEADSSSPDTPKDEPGVTSEQAQDAASAEESSQSQSAPKKERKTGRVLLILFLLLMVGALGGGCYWLWLQLDAQLQRNAQLTSAGPVEIAPDPRIDVLQTDLQAIKSNSSSDAAALRKQVDELELQLRNTQLSVETHTRRINELGVASRSEWLLAEAEYLMRLANQRMPTERSTRNPLALLISADEILRDLDDPELLAVRKALADDITALRLAGQVDREGIFLELQSLEDAVSGLPILVGLEEVSSPDASGVVEDESETGGWRDRLVENLSSIAAGLKGLVQINRRAELVQPLLSAREEAVVRENLRIVLEQAQWALLREEQAIYRASLENAQKWLSEYFQLNQQADTVLSRIEELRDENIVQKLPDISGSLSALHTLITNRHRRTPEAESAQ